MPAKASTSAAGRRPGSARLRRELVAELEKSGCVKGAAVRRAFLALPRERFLTEVAEREGLERVYRDEAIVTSHDPRGAPTSSSSQPSLMASMLERLELRPGQRVLEVGAGTGYNAALLARIVGARGTVVSVELDPATARRARRSLAAVDSRAKVVRGDGREGWARGAPYDRIVVTASTQEVAAAWHEQLAEGGLLELPLVVPGAAGFQAILTFRREAHTLRSVAFLHGGFMPLRDAPDVPPPSPPPSLAATGWSDGRPRQLVVLGGHSLRRLSEPRKRALLSMALSKPRTRELGIRASRSALTLYLMVEAPEDRFVGGWPRAGLISGGGRGLALLAGGAKTLTRVESYGDRAAERQLVSLVDRWRERGRPGGDDLSVEVRFPGARMRLGWAGEGPPRPSSAAGRDDRLTGR